MLRYLIIVASLVSVLTSCDEYADYAVAGDLQYKLDSITALPQLVDECSGFIMVDQRLVAINDGFHGPDLHYFDILANTSTVVNIPTIVNVDWEAIMMADGEIVIADIGNNRGIRSDLKLYHLDSRTHELLHTTDLSYPGQTYQQSDTHNFDAEAIAYVDGQICIFSKNRGNNYTDLYTAPIYSSDFVLRESIIVPWRVTDAYHHEASGCTLLLCNQRIDGLHMSAIEIIRLQENSGYSRVATIPFDIHDKLEAITLKEGSTFYIGSERESNGLGMLYEIHIVGL